MKYLSFHDKQQSITASLKNQVETKTNNGKNKITELRTILQRESQHSEVYKQTKSVNNLKTVKTVMTLT